MANALVDGMIGVHPPPSPALLLSLYGSLSPPAFKAPKLRPDPRFCCMFAVCVSLELPKAGLDCRSHVHRPARRALGTSAEVGTDCLRSLSNGLVSSVNQGSPSQLGTTGRGTPPTHTPWTPPNPPFKRLGQFVFRTFGQSKFFFGAFGASKNTHHWGGGGAGPSCVTFRRVAVFLRGLGQSPVLPFACCVGSILSDGRCGGCSLWCRFRVSGAQ